MVVDSGTGRSQRRMWPLRLPLRVQVGAVLALFVAALALLLATSAAVVERERRRVRAKDVLDRAGDALARVGQPALTGLPDWPQRLEPGEWDALNARLEADASQALGAYEAVEGGYFQRDSRRFLGAAFPTRKPSPAPKADRRSRGGPPPREADLIEIQADASIRRNQALFVVSVVPPSTVAIRTAPVRDGSRVVGATWVMTRLVDPLFTERSLSGYRAAAGVALGGVVVSLALTAGLARTVRVQATERERLQAELRRSEHLASLGKLVAGVAHEVRNPLAGIRSTVQLWQRGLGPDEESLDGLVAEADRLEVLVTRLLQFSRTGAQELAPGDLNAVVAEAARLALPAADAAGVAVELDLEPSLPPVSLAPPALLQVFRNLTTNAIHATPHGGRVTLFSRAGRPGVVEAGVADTGSGIPPEVRAHLFEPFVTTKPEGTGLGLAIAREIVVAHRGDLRGGPRRDGQGAEFTMTLPAAHPEDRDPTRTPAGALP